MEKLIIIGTGPAGLTSAIYAARTNMNPLIFEGFQSGGIPGGQLMLTDVIENFPGFPLGIHGQSLMAGMRDQAAKFGTRMIMEDVTGVSLGEWPFKVTSMSDVVYEAETVIIATGASAKRLPLMSEKRLWGRGISACAVCDGALPMFRNKELAVIGGGDTAIEEAVHLTQFGSLVYLIHRRDEFRASKFNAERAIKHPKIKVLWNNVVEDFLGDTRISGLRLKDTVTGTFSEINVTGAFEAIGHNPNTGFLNGQLPTDALGYLITKPGSTQTSIDGVFAAGDVQDHRFRQAITAAGSGCMAALEAERWLQEKKGI